jgi:hypothetical protein
VIPVAYLQAGRDPNVEDADVDCCDEDGGGDHDIAGAFAIWNDNADSVDDDLEEQLDLNTPPEYCGMLVLVSQGGLWYCIAYG